MQDVLLLYLYTCLSNADKNYGTVKSTIMKWILENAIKLFTKQEIVFSHLKGPPKM